MKIFAWTLLGPLSQNFIFKLTSIYRNTAEEHYLISKIPLEKEDLKRFFLQNFLGVKLSDGAHFLGRSRKIAYFSSLR